MVQSIGKRLQEARLGRGLSLEDVQHLTRIRLNQLAGMENQDLTVFASPSYARGFYALYGRFLGLDLTEFLQSMESAGLKEEKHHPYLRPRIGRGMQGRRSRARHLQPLPQAGRLALLGLFLALAIGIAAWFGNPQWRRHRLGQETPVTSTEPAAGTLPLLAGTDATPPASPTAADPPPINLADSYSSVLSPQFDIRSTPPPVLKALPAEDGANSSGKPGVQNSKKGRPSPEVRRPAPFTR